MENLIIGKANTMYTLWNKRVINHESYTTERYTFLKNVSKDLNKVKRLYPELIIDESLRGATRIEKTIKKEPEQFLDRFDFGQYEGNLLNSVDDTKYLVWYLNSNKDKNATQAEWAKENLDNIRFYDGPFYDGVFMTIKEYEQIVEKRAKLEAIVNKIKEEKSIICTATTNIDYKGFLIVMYEDVRITVHFTGEIKEYNYQGFYYYLPVIGGKAKRIKNKEIVLNVEDVEVCYCMGDYIQITANSIDLSK
jgi:hypothetical protein